MSIGAKLSLKRLSAIHEGFYQKELEYSTLMWNRGLRKWKCGCSCFLKALNGNGLLKRCLDVSIKPIYFQCFVKSCTLEEEYHVVSSFITIFRLSLNLKTRSHSIAWLAAAYDPVLEDAWVNCSTTLLSISSESIHLIITANWDSYGISSSSHLLQNFPCRWFFLAHSQLTLIENSPLQPSQFQI